MSFEFTVFFTSFEFYIFHSHIDFYVSIKRTTFQVWNLIGVSCVCQFVGAKLKGA